MLVSTSTIKTSKCSAYLKKFCRHFTHKLPTEFDDAHGRVDFAVGPCLLTAGDEQLVFTLESDSKESMDRLEDVVARHMERFAFRDEIKMDWQRDTQ